jgi:hypothetical protein
MDHWLKKNTIINQRLTTIMMVTVKISKLWHICYLLLLHPNDLQRAEGYAVGTALMNYQINLSDIFTDRLILPLRHSRNMHSLMYQISSHRIQLRQHSFISCTNHGTVFHWALWWAILSSRSKQLSISVIFYFYILMTFNELKVMPLVLRLWTIK